MPPKMTTLPAASLHDAGKKNKGGFARWVSAGPCVPRVIVSHPPPLTSDTLARQQGQGLWKQEPRHNHGPGNSFPVSHKPCGEAGGPQPLHIMAQTQHPTAAVTREDQNHQQRRARGASPLPQPCSSSWLTGTGRQRRGSPAASSGSPGYQRLE